MSADTLDVPLPIEPFPVEVVAVDSTPSTRPATEARRVRRTLLARQLLILAAAAAILLISRVLVVQQDVIFVPGFNLTLPGVCMWRNWLGVDCPGCGLTRGIVCLAHGNARDAWQFNPASWLVFGLLAVQLPWRAWQAVRLAQHKPLGRHPSLPAVGAVVVTALVVQWLWRIAP